MARVWKFILGTAAALALIVASAPRAHADSVTFTVSGLTSGGQSVSAKATFTVNSAGQLTITLSNTTAGISNAGQLLVGLSFGFTGGTGTPTLGSESGNSVNVDSSGVVTSAGAVSSGWGFAANSSSVLLADISQTVGGLTAQGTPPSLTLLGPACADGTYCDANSSIAGSPSHNPFLTGDFTIVVNIPGLTSATQINNVNFFFSTASGVSLPGTPTTPTPEPASLLLLGTGLLGLGAAVRRRIKA